MDDRILGAAVLVAGVAVLPLAVGHLAALLVHGGWPSYRLVDLPGILGRFVSDPGDPAEAWEPVNTGAAVPGPVAWWGTLIVLAVIAGLVSLLVWAARPHATAPVTGWAGRDEQRSLHVRLGCGHRLILGVGDGHRLAVRDRHSVLVLGVAHTGKTSGVTVPAIVEWEGSMVVASTKGHLIDETIGWRSHQGDVHVYDPAGVTRHDRSGWSLLADCTTWEGALGTAADLTLAASGSVGASGGADGAVSEPHNDLWRSSMAISLAPFLLAAASSGRPIAVVAEWIERAERDEVLAVLDAVDRTAARAHRSTFMRSGPARSAFLYAMHETLSVCTDPVVAASMDRHEILPRQLLEGGVKTLYLTAPEHDRDRFRPLCAMIVRRVLAAAYEASARAGGPLDPPLLVVLDDLLGIAPNYDLAEVASTSGARGVQLVSIFQGVAQIGEFFGDARDLVVKSHAAKLILPSSRGTMVRSGEGLVDDAHMRELGAGEAALLYGISSPARVSLRPWYRDRSTRRRVKTPQNALLGAGAQRPGTPTSV